jgi:hypothetical protein
MNKFKFFFGVFHFALLTFPKACAQDDSTVDEELRNNVADTIHGGAAMQLAEQTPEEFEKLLRSRLLADLLKERDLKEYKCLDKYEKFVAKIVNTESKEMATDLIEELKETYKDNWNFLYDVPLSERWHEIKGNPIGKKNFAEILQLQGITVCDEDDIADFLRPVRDLTLIGSVNYLDSLETAVKKISEDEDLKYNFRSTKISSRNRIESPGFPLDSFHFHSFDVISDQDNVNQIIFIVDDYTRVVALQEVIESPKSIRLYEHTTDRSVYNFVQNRRKGRPSYKISYNNGQSGLSQNRVENRLIPRFIVGPRSLDQVRIVLEAELIDDENNPREFSRLILPYNIAKIFLFCSTKVTD